MRMLLPFAALAALAACSGQASDKDKLNQAAAQSTPEAAQVLQNAAENGMDANAAMNEAGQAQAQNSASSGNAANSD